MATARTRTAPAPAKTRTSRATRSAERNAEARANLAAVPPADDTKPAETQPAETQPAPADPTKITASVALQPIAKQFYRPQIVASDGTVIAECPHMARYGHDSVVGARACFRSMANGAGWKIDNSGLADGDVLAPDLTADWIRQENSPRSAKPAS